MVDVAHPELARNDVINVVLLRTGRDIQPPRGVQDTELQRDLRAAKPSRHNQPRSSFRCVCVEHAANVVGGGGKGVKPPSDAGWMRAQG